MTESVSAPDSGSTADQAWDAPFVDPVAMETDPEGLFPGDRGVLDLDERRVLVRLLRSRFLVADRSRDDWAVLMNSRLRIESHLHDLFVRLVIDHDRGVAYKEQVRSDDGDIPILLRDDPYSRAETLVLVHLRTVFQRESTAGESAALVDVEEIEQTVLTYFSQADGNTARRQKAIRNAIARLERDGLLEEESEGRYRISPLVEIVLSSQRLRELADWLREQTAGRSQTPSSEPEVEFEAEELADDDVDDSDDDDAADQEPEEATL